MAPGGAGARPDLPSVVTHLFDTSAALAQYFDENGAARVDALLSEPEVTPGVSVLTLYEVYTTVLHRFGSDESATRAVEAVRAAMAEVLPVDDAVLAVALDLRRASAARIALADLLIAATAARAGATLVHRDPHFAALPAGRPAQEALPDKA